MAAALRRTATGCRRLRDRLRPLDSELLHAGCGVCSDAAPGFRRRCRGPLMRQRQRRKASSIDWRSTSSSVAAPRAPPCSEGRLLRRAPACRQSSGSSRARRRSRAHGCCRARNGCSSAANTAAGMLVNLRFSARWRRLTKYHTSRGMSSVRSRSGGSAIGNTLRR